MTPSRRSAVPPFEVMDIVAAAKARGARGEYAALLCVGEPSGGAPLPVREAARRALADDGYTQPSGLPELRSAIAGHYLSWYGVEVDPAAVVITTGASSAFTVATLTGLDAGARVALPAPGYPAYRNMLRSLGCQVVDVAAGTAQDYRLTVAELAATHRAEPLDAVVVASPANPTGTMLDAAAMAELVGWCREHDVLLISDEIYHGLTYAAGADETPWRGESALAHTRDAVVIGSFSKYWGMTGWRLGWAVLPAPLLAPAEAVAGNLQLCAPTLSQRAALAAFDPASIAECDRRRADLQITRDHVLARSGELGWGRIAPPDGAFYLWVDVSASGLDSRTYSARLLAETGVALAPGTDFDPVAGERFVRVSFSPGLTVVREACDRIAAWHRVG